MGGEDRVEENLKRIYYESTELSKWIELSSRVPEYNNVPASLKEILESREVVKEMEKEDTRKDRSSCEDEEARHNR